MANYEEPSEEVIKNLAEVAYTKGYWGPFFTKLMPDTRISGVSEDTIKYFEQFEGNLEKVPTKLQQRIQDMVMAEFAKIEGERGKKSEGKNPSGQKR